MTTVRYQVVDLGDGTIWCITDTKEKAQLIEGSLLACADLKPDLAVIETTTVEPFNLPIKQKMFEDVNSTIRPWKGR